MGKVAASFKIMPESEESNLEATVKELQSNIKGDFYIGSINVEELAFGIKAIKLVVVMDDKEGLIDKLETIIRGVKGVGEIDVEEVSLIS